MIYYSIPFDSTKNLGVYYNKFMSILPNDNDFGCFIDADAMFTTHTYGKQLEDIAKEYPQVGVFVGVTNRIGCKWQLAPEADRVTNDVKYHREFGEALLKNKYLYCEDVTHKPKEYVLSGFLIMIKKSTWKKIGGFKETGMLGVDNDIHWKCQDHNIPVYKMDGVYLYHWYRNGEAKNKQHLL